MAYNPAVRRKSYLKMKERVLEYSSNYNLKRKFNLTRQEYDTLKAAQDNVCAICKQSCTRALAVDHNHTTGNIRGLLCNKCNRGLGYFKDSPVLLVEAADYLLERS